MKKEKIIEKRLLELKREENRNLISKNNSPLNV